MTDTTTTPITAAFPAVSPLLHEAWTRARAACVAYLNARGVADPVEVTGLLVELQSLSLLIAAEPAQHMDDLAPKAMVLSLWRDVLVAEAGRTHTLALIERAIAIDMEVLQPVEPELAAFVAERTRS